MTRDARMAAAFAAVAAVWTLGAFALGVADALAHLAPALLVLLPLLGGRYPGDDALARVARGGHAPGPPRVSRARPRPKRALPPLVPRGGRLLAAGLAGRAPPLAPS